MSWSTVSGATAYVVSNGNVSSPDLTTNSYDWGGLSPGTYMCFTVTAKDGSGQSPWSPYACTTTLPVPTPTNVTAVPTNSSTIHVVWSTVSGATAYVVSNGNVSSANLTTNSYDWGGLSPGTYMCFTVAAKDGSGQSPWSSYACATTPAATAAAPRRPPWLQLFTPDSGTFHLYWLDAASGAQYEVSNGDTSQITAAGATSLDWGGLSPNTYMCFKIRAFTASGASDWTPNTSPFYVCGTTPSSSSTVPAAPTSVSASAPNSHLTRLTWTDLTGGTAQYQIDNGATTLLTAAGATSFDWGGESPGTYMCFRIRAVSNTGASAWAPGSSPYYVCTTTPSATCQASAVAADSSGNVTFYHGTSLAAAQAIQSNGINPTLGSGYVDFGRGFYVTTDLAQAQAWAIQNYAGQNPSVIQFTIPYSALTPGTLCGLVFPLSSASEGYLALVRALRMIQQPVGCAGYDFVEGPLLINPTDFLSWTSPAIVSGHQDTFCTAAGASILDAGFVQILPAS